MFKKSTEIQVGIFLSTAVVILIVALTSFEDGGISFFRARYELNMKAKSVEGLGKGSLVQLLGVPVGNIKEVKLLKEGDVLIVLRIYEEFKPMITEGSEAYIKTQGALGDKIIFINPGDNSREVLAEGGYVKSVTAPSILESFFEDNAQTNETSGVIGDFKNISTELKELLTELNEIAKEIPKEDLKRLVKDLSKVVRKIERGEGTLGSIINDPALHSKIKTLLGGSKGDKFVTEIVRKSIESSGE